MTSSKGHDQSEELRKVWELMKSCEFAMLTTVHEDGTLHSRPMATLRSQDFEGTLWFFTKLHSAKVAEVNKRHEVNLSYAHPSKQNYVSLSGTGEILRDKQKAQALWSEPLRTWFPDGLDDPELALLKVEVKIAQYWDSPSSVLVHAYGYVKAAVTGEPPKAGDVGTVRLS
ncbi:pyridoxamine 5'-phosphate oxidase family protein [Azospirillum sp. SYSU D00513]|uniref:pyridoxamine 5'-phosphate oxidase family protein n=1 Tax=Azospirillum sp. SYSU D00513 TaxID=2812561 RepID=UPI001A9762C1|nr:pyridoxamine 5'-phosphate oxidase family protein [Azospirillum sp. SYSU D00513]